MTQTFLLLLLVLLAAGRHPEGALSHERRAAGVERRGDPALFLASLFALEAGGEGAPHGVAQALPLVGKRVNSISIHVKTIRHQ